MDKIRIKKRKPPQKKGTDGFHKEFSKNMKTYFLILYHKY